MARRGLSEAKIIETLKQVEAARKVEDVAREIGVSKHTIYGWKAKYGGLQAVGAQRLRHLSNENNRLKRLVADLSLDREMLKAVIAKYRPGLIDRRVDANWLREQYAVSERRVCGLLSIAVSSYRYVTRLCDEDLRQQLVQLAQEKPRFGYRRLHALLRREGETPNHKRVYRVYREAGLGLGSKKREQCMRAGAAAGLDPEVKQEWALDSARHQP